MNEKKIWLCEQYAQKTWTLSLAFAQEAARSGHFGRGYAVVADEARILANKLFDYTAKVKFDGGSNDFRGIVDFAVMTGLLAVNTMIEVLRVNSVISDISINKSMAVLAEDLRKLALDINALADNQAWEKPFFVIPEITSPLKSTHTFEYFFYYSIGGIPLIENISNIMEVLFLPKADTENEIIKPRNKLMPCINCYKQFDLQHTCIYPDRQTVMVIRPEGTSFLGSHDGLYAVLIDDLDVSTIFQSKIGCAVPPNPDGLFAPYARECWDVVGNDQLIFIDWEKLI